MDAEKYRLVMHYLDKIEEALNDIALAVGHPTMDVFFGTQELPQAA